MKTSKASVAIKRGWKTRRKSGNDIPWNKSYPPSKIELKKLYEVEKLGSWKLAAHYGVTQHLVLIWLKNYKIPRRSHAEASKITRNGKSGKDHHCWKGDKVSYSALHTWVRNNKPKSQLCNKCGRKTKLDLSNKGIYDRNFDNWEWLCRKCHMKADGRNKK